MTNKSLLSLLIILLAGCVAAGHREAEAYYDRGDYQLAADAYRDFIRENPKAPGLPDAYLGLAWSEYQLGHYDESAEAADVLRSRFPADRLVPTAAYVVALGFYETRRLVEAVTELESLILHHADAAIVPDARFLLARVHFALLRYEPAAENFRIYLEKYGSSPSAAPALLGRAEALVKLARWEEAVEVYEEFLRRFPREPSRAEVSMKLAKILQAQGAYDRAEELLQNLRTDYPEWDEPRAVLADLAAIYLTTQRFDDAARIHQDLFDLTPDEEAESKSGYAIRLAEYHATRGDTEMARRFYARIADDLRGVSSFHARALAWMFEYELVRGRPENAVHYGTKFLERYYDHPLAESIDRNLIALLIRAGRIEEGRERLDLLVRRKFSVAEPRDFFRLAGLAIELGVPEAAIEYATEGLSRAELVEDKLLTASGLNYLMIAYKMKGTPAEAVRHFWKLMEIDPRYLTADEVVYWTVVEKKFFEDARVPPQFATRETFRNDWKIAVHLGEIDPVHADSTTVGIVTSLSRILTTSLLTDNDLRRVTDKEMRLLPELAARQDFKDIPISWFPLRSTVGADWVVSGRVTRDPSRGEKNIVVHIRMLRIDYEGVFPFEYWYYLGPDEVVLAPTRIAQETLGRLKLYRPDR